MRAENLFQLWLIRETAVLLEENQRDGSVRRTQLTLVDFVDGKGHEQRNVGSLWILEK